MDPVAIAHLSVATSTAKVQMALAARIAKMNAGHEASIADLVQQASKALKSALPAGVGGALDLAA
jgi:hypothetical protein